MARGSIEVTGAEKVVKALSAIAQVLGDVRPALTVVAGSLKTNIQLGFKTGHAPDGSPWRSLRMRSGQPLKDTGRLAASIVYRTDATSAEIGTNVCYGIVHQFGATVEAGQPPHQTICGQMTKGSPFLRWTDEGGKSHFAKRVHIPPRPFLPTEGLPPAWSQDAMQRLSAAVAKQL